VAARLDRIDMNILIQLQQNGRVTNAQLADAVGLSPSPCLMRVKRLQVEGYITGFTTNLDLRKLGESLTILLEVTLEKHRTENFQRFEARLRRIKEVIECHMISGGFDYMVTMVVRDLTHFQEIMEALADDNAGIAQYFSYIVVKTPIRRQPVPLRHIFEDD
jgi:DNA-binding Lrp family transcriptional regulator